MRKLALLSIAALIGVGTATAEPAKKTTVSADKGELRMMLLEESNNQLDPGLQNDLELDLDIREQLDLRPDNEHVLRQHHDFHLLQDLNRVDNPFLHHKVPYDSPGIDL
jgi:hypothetical protein